MFSAVFDLAKSALLTLPPETAHETSLRALEAGVYPRPTAPDSPLLSQTVFGLTFANPIGVAAGFDKDARVPDAILGVGCGFAEVGTITPEPQVGNPQPRVFRLPEQRAIINRLGFNNGGHGAAWHGSSTASQQGYRRGQYRREQGHRRQAGRLRKGDRYILRRRVVLRRQHLVAEYTGLARPAGACRARCAVVAGDGGAGGACRQ